MSADDQQQAKGRAEVTCSPALAGIIEAIEAGHKEAMEALGGGLPNDLCQGFGDGYRVACETLLEQARQCQASD